MIRAFVGIAVPDKIAGLLEAAQTGLDFGRVVPPEHFHLTLAFLGEQPEQVVEDVHHQLGRISAAGMDLALDGLGVFGGEAPRVLFAEVKPDTALSDLRRKVRGAAREGGLELDHKRFHPHITLARFGKGLWPDQAGELHNLISKRMRLVTGAFQATKFTLYESRLGKDGPVYEAIATYDLGGAD
ncbi:MAG: RNA 2',3'-cyclic phosphodiesterase [Pseudomonadota bacterium]